MRVSDFKEGLICEGDFVVDRMDDEIRQIESVTVHDETNATLNMTDGGVMGLDEVMIQDIRLESEV